MTPDLKTLAWLAPLSGVLSFWWIFEVDRCLDAHFRNHWNQWFPPPPEPPSTDPDAAVVHNPYGILACDYWPQPIDHVINWSSFLLLVALIGFLAARGLEQRPVKRAGLITLASLFLAIGFADAVNLPWVLRGWGDFVYQLAAVHVAASVVIIIVGALLAMLAAWLTLKWRARG